MRAGPRTVTYTLRYAATNAEAEAFRILDEIRQVIYGRLMTKRNQDLLVWLDGKEYTPVRLSTVSIDGITIVLKVRRIGKDGHATGKWIRIPLGVTGGLDWIIAREAEDIKGRPAKRKKKP